MKLVVRPWAGRYPAYKAGLRRVKCTWECEDRAVPEIPKAADFF